MCNVEAEYFRDLTRITVKPLILLSLKYLLVFRSSCFANLEGHQKKGLDSIWPKFETEMLK